MANLLVLGVGPLPFEHGDKLHAPGIRTWQIARALAAEHHFVTLCVIEFGDFAQTGKTGPPPPAVRQDAGANISLVKLVYHPEHSVQALRTLHLATRFAAVISTTDIMNGIAADLGISVPLWLDYNGDPFAEKQLQARLYQHDGSLLPQWELYLKGLTAGDHFSVCSNPQRHALIGQLAFAGRLTAETSGEELVSVIPNCSRVMSERTPKRAGTLKGKQIPATAFLVLWSGGYNTWCDPELLFRGLALAMQQNEAIHFATTGGAIDGHDGKSFQLFRDLVDQSPLRDRFVFLGWVPTDEVASYYEQADLAVFTDRYSVEGELGTRTRLVDWLQFNVPVACTNLCEMTQELEARKLIYSFRLGDAVEFSNVLLRAAADPQSLRDMAIRARQWLDSELNEAVALRPLLNWAKAPQFAGDKHSDQQHNMPRSGLARLLSSHFNHTSTTFETINESATKRAPAPPGTGTDSSRGGFRSRLTKIFSRQK